MQTSYEQFLSHKQFKSVNSVNLSELHKVFILKPLTILIPLHVFLFLLVSKVHATYKHILLTDFTQ